MPPVILLSPALGVSTLGGPQYTLSDPLATPNNANPSFNLSGPLAFQVLTPSDITVDDYFVREQPAKSDELYNRVVINTQPLSPAGELSEVFSSSDPISVPGGQSLVYTAIYSEKPVLTEEALASVSELTGGAIGVTHTTFYAWGADVTLTNVGGTTGSCKLTITGRALKVQGGETVSAEDSESIRSNGLLTYEYPDNPLVQSEAMAAIIADKLLESYKTPRKDTRVEWRGNPALELGDTITVPIYMELTGPFKITRNQINFDDGLRATTEGRRI